MIQDGVEKSDFLMVQNIQSILLRVSTNLLLDLICDFNYTFHFCRTRKSRLSSQHLFNL